MSGAPYSASESEVVYSPVVVFDEKYDAKMICTQLQKQHLFPEVGVGLEILPGDAAELHEFAQHYNWDNGVGVLRWIIRQAFCDRGTALMIFWRGGPGYYIQYAQKGDIPAYQLDGYELIEEVERRYEDGFYQKGDFLFDPRDDDGRDRTQQYAHIQSVRAISDLMYEPSVARKSASMDC